MRLGQACDWLMTAVVDRGAVVKKFFVVQVLLELSVGSWRDEGILFHCGLDVTIGVIGKLFSAR